MTEQLAKQYFWNINNWSIVSLKDFSRYENIYVYKNYKYFHGKNIYI